MALIGEMQYLTIGENTYSIPTSGGSTVSITRSLTSGTKSATISVDGTSYDLYAPTPNAGTVTSVRVQATSPVQSSTSTVQSSTLNTTISLADAYGDTKNPYGTKTANYVLAGPSSGSAAAPSFRKLVAADIPDLSDTYATQTDLENLPEPMIFKGSLGTGGTVTSLPTAAASNEGHTYKVITAGTYASQSAKVGDTFISDGSAWVLIPSGDEPSGTVTSVTLTQGTGITVSSSGTAITTSGSRTISLASITKDDTTSTASPSHGGTFTAVDSITYDTYGRVTGVNTKTVTLPADSNTDTKVTQAYSTANNSYPVLFSATAGVSSTSSRGATTAILNNAIYANPSTGNLHVTQLNGVTVGTSPKFTDTTYTNVSEFTNDAGYITSADVPEGASAYTGTISAVSTTASNGTNNGFARGDHVHNITKTTIDSVLGTGSGTTKFYREDGSWATPNYIANTDEKLQVAAVTSGTTYYPIVGTGTTAATRQYDTTGFIYVGTNGTTSAVGSARLTLGNSTASGSANNKQGALRLYSTSTGWGELIQGAVSSSVSVTHTFPAKSGTVAHTSDIPDVSGFITDAGVTKITTTAGTHSAITNATGAVSFNVPTKTSHLTNDSNFVTSSGVTSITLKAGSGISLDTDNTAITTTGTRTISHADTSSQASSSNSGRTYIQSITLDGYGHVTGISTATESVTNTDTKLQVAEVTSGTIYYPIVGTGTTAATRQYDTTGFSYQGTNGTTSAVGCGKITLGNSTASGTANNKQGQLVMYGSTAYAHTIKGAPTAARTLNLPDKDGTIALTSDIPTVPTKTSDLTNDSGFITSSALNNYLPLTGGQVTGPVTFGDTISIDDATIGSLVVNGDASFTNNIQANTINGIAVGSNPKFTDTTYSSKAAASGGTDVSLVTTGEKYTWNSKTSNTGTVTSITLTQGDGISIGSSGTAITTTGTRTIALSTSGVTANSYGPSDNASPSHGGTFSVPYVTVDKYGRITAASTKTITLPADNNTDTKVTQGNSTSTQWRKVLLHYSANDDSEAAVTSVTNQVFASQYVSVKASDGSLHLGGTLTSSKINSLITGGTQTAAVTTSPYKPALWNFDAGITPTNGDVVFIQAPGGGHSYGEYLSLDNGTTYKPITHSGTSKMTTHYGSGSAIMLVYDSDWSTSSMYPLAGGTSTTTITGGAWRVINGYIDGNTYTTAYCSTAAATAAKAATMSGYAATANRYVMVTMTAANSAASAITLNINGTGAKPIYINGSASSSSNYTLPAGSYLVFYDGTNYHFRTDGYMTVKYATQAPSSETTFMPVLARTGTDIVNRIHEYTRLWIKAGSTSANGYVYLGLGNNTATGIDTNSFGCLRLYSVDTGYSNLRYVNVANNVDNWLPSTSGTLLNTGTTSFTQTITSGQKIGTLRLDNINHTLYAPSVSYCDIWPDDISGSITVSAQNTNYAINLKSITTENGGFTISSNGIKIPISGYYLVSMSTAFNTLAANSNLMGCGLMDTSSNVVLGPVYNRMNGTYDRVVVEPHVIQLTKDTIIKPFVRNNSAAGGVCHAIYLSLVLLNPA